MSVSASRTIPVFNRFHRSSGSETAEIVGPLSAWEDNLPDGVSYNPSYDRIEDSQGNVVDPLPYWTTDKRDIIADNNDSEVAVLIAAGTLNTGSIAFYFLPFDNGADVLMKSFRILYRGKEYVVNRVIEQDGMYRVLVNLF